MMKSTSSKVGADNCELIEVADQYNDKCRMGFSCGLPKNYAEEI